MIGFESTPSVPADELGVRQENLTLNRIESCLTTAEALLKERLIVFTGWAAFQPTIYY